MVEEIFEGGAKEIDDQDVVEAFLAEVVDVRNAGYRKGQLEKFAKSGRKLVLRQPTRIL